jgi:uncharacterized protein
MSASSGAALILQHALVFAIVVLAPIWDRHATRDLKTSGDPNVKERYYRITSALLWGAAAVACIASGGYTRLAHVDRVAGDAPWLSPTGHAAPVVLGAIVGMLFVLLLPAVLALLNSKVRERSARAFKELAFFLPVTPRERAWWVIVSVSAGVCEEVVFRGFLLHYLHAGPWHVPLAIAIIVAAAIFGVQHLYQGAVGVVQTTIIGAIFGAIFLVTGSLVVPMLLHCVMDLRVLLLIAPPPAAAAT